jgi:hypothetical protein
MSPPPPKKNNISSINYKEHKNLDMGLFAKREETID